MRDINECRAEIFRRSENRIRERRERKKRVAAFVAMCIPLGLMVYFGPMLFAGNGTVEESYPDVGEADGYKGADVVNKSEAASNGNEYHGSLSDDSYMPNGGDSDRNSEKHNNPEGIVLLSLTVKMESEKGVDFAKITKTDIVTDIYNTVSDIIESFDREDYTLYTGDNKEMLNQTLGPADKYTLYFFGESGDSSEYTLEGQRLTRLSDGKTGLLTLSEARMLRASFGFND